MHVPLILNGDPRVESDLTTAYLSDVIERKDLGTWLEGAPTDPDYRPGSRYGVPADGPGSPARLGIRFTSWIIDALVSAGGAYLAFGPTNWGSTAVFLAINLLMLPLFGATIGQFFCGLRLMPVSGRSPMVLRALIRTLLMALLIPLVIQGRDRQLGHDMAAGVLVIRATS